MQTLRGHKSHVYRVLWSPDGEVLISGFDDRTIGLWNPDTGQQTDILEGHCDAITDLSLSYDGRLLTSRSLDGTVSVWRTDTWESVVLLEEVVKPEGTGTYRWNGGLAFHPKSPVLATLGEGERIIYIWDIDIATLLRTTQKTPSVHYTNAKVVLVGDSGVGKSGLGLALVNQPFVPTESTHGRKIWKFDEQEFEFEGGRKETRETILWDLADQPGYRFIHQLHLDEVAVALVVFDARSETDPFAGVQYWDRALRQAQLIQGNTTLLLKKFLVAARIDRGGIPASPERIQSVVQNLGFDGYFETSAKEGYQIAELREAILDAIDWEQLPRVSSTRLFQSIKTFLVAEKETGRILSTVDDLYRLFLASNDAAPEVENLRVQFEACIGRVESADLIKQLSFGNLVLLQPELLDTYASALVNTVRDEPDGLGSITEERVRTGDFHIPADERLKDKEQERLLLIAMVEDLLRRELVLREEPFLVFPSQSTRENTDLPDPEGKSVVFQFEGPILNIYATLAVRLSYSGLFKKKELWKNAVTYTANAGGTCGMLLHNLGEGRGELTLFFDKETSKETQLNFEEYIYLHLQRRTLPESLKRQRVVVCQGCGWVVTDQTIQLLWARGNTKLQCPICGEHILLLEHKEDLVAVSSPHILNMDRAADRRRDQEAAKSTLQGKLESSDFDVFLCHNNRDKPEVKEIGMKLKEYGILPWLDEWNLRPGFPWQPALEEQIERIKAAAVFVGTSGVGPWQDIELRGFLQQFVARQCPVIPVILPDCDKVPELPVFLQNMTWVDFRKRDPDPIDQLIWGITGKRSSL